MEHVGGANTEDSIFFHGVTINNLYASQTRTRTLAILQNEPIFKNPSADWDRIYGYPVWVDFSEENEVRDNFTNLPHEFS